MAEGTAELFNELSFHLLSYLEEQAGVSELAFENRTGCTPEDVFAWERTNAPYKLPGDLKAFLAAFDGLRFSWRVDMTNRGNITVGSMRLHRLRDVLQLPLDADDDDGLRGGLRKCDDDDGDGRPGEGQVLAAFGIEHYPRVALLFRGEPNASGASPKASVWFQDLACKWHYVSPSFTHYFRLMVVHLGIIGWQYAYTDIGLDNVTRQWMRLYCPERLAADDALDLEADAGDDAPAAR